VAIELDSNGDPAYPIGTLPPDIAATLAKIRSGWSLSRRKRSRNDSQASSDPTVRTISYTELFDAMHERYASMDWD
jgi:hypothetical protein